MAYNLIESLKSIYKIFIKFILLLIFLFFFNKSGYQLKEFSHASILTVTSFIVFGMFIGRINSAFNFRQKEQAKNIILSLIVILLTDLFAYLHLVFLSTENLKKFKFTSLDTLFTVIIFQYLFFILAFYIGKSVFRNLNPKTRTLLIYEENQDLLLSLSKAIEADGEEYEYVGSCRFDDCDLSQKIIESDQIILLDLDREKQVDLINFAFENKVEIAVLPNIDDIFLMSGSYQVYDDKLMLKASVKNPSLSERFFKRFIDLSFSALGLILTFPLWLLIALAIKIEDRGKVFFKQSRFTYDRKIFTVYKFRSMKEGVDNYSVTQNDPRITKVGKFIRKTRLDELPQLINVFLGHMSLVGPRPEMVENARYYESIYPEFKYRLRCKAGLTGIAQIEGRYNTSAKDKLLMDLVYIQNFNPLLDFKLIFKTFTIFFKKDSTEGFESRQL